MKMNEDKIRRTVKSAALIPMMMRFALIHVMITQKKRKRDKIELPSQTQFIDWKFGDRHV